MVKIDFVDFCFAARDCRTFKFQGEPYFPDGSGNFRISIEPAVPEEVGAAGQRKTGRCTHFDFAQTVIFIFVRGDIFCFKLRFLQQGPLCLDLLSNGLHDVIVSKNSVGECQSAVRFCNSGDGIFICCTCREKDDPDIFCSSIKIFCFAPAEGEFFQNFCFSDLNVKVSDIHLCGFHLLQSIDHPSADYFCSAKPDGGIFCKIMEPSQDHQIEFITDSSDPEQRCGIACNKFFSHIKEIVPAFQICRCHILQLFGRNNEVSGVTFMKRAFPEFFQFVKIEIHQPCGFSVSKVHIFHDQLFAAIEIRRVIPVTAEHPEQYPGFHVGKIGICAGGHVMFINGSSDAEPFHDFEIQTRTAQRGVRSEITFVWIRIVPDKDIFRDFAPFFQVSESFPIGNMYQIGKKVIINGRKDRHEIVGENQTVWRNFCLFFPVGEGSDLQFRKIFLNTCADLCQKFKKCTAWSSVLLFFFQTFRTIAELSAVVHGREFNITISIIVNGFLIAGLGVFFDIFQEDFPHLLAGETHLFVFYPFSVFVHGIEFRMILEIFVRGHELEN